MEKFSTQYKREHMRDFGKEKLQVLFSDSSIFVINKPAGMLTVPYPGSKARTALGIVCRLMKNRGLYSRYHRPFVVHRLDRDTSGIMMFALNVKLQRYIMQHWKTFALERLYRAVAENPAVDTLGNSGLIDDRLAFNAYNMGFVPKDGAEPKKNAKQSSLPRRFQSYYEKHLDFSNGKAQFKTVEARTNYKVIMRGPTHTLFELSLDTGKKNQIRAHLASKGFPIAGDENYRAKTDPFHRLLLHARTLEIIHPETKEKMKFEVAEPNEWFRYVEAGDFHSEETLWQKQRNSLKGKSK